MSVNDPVFPREKAVSGTVFGAHLQVLGTKELGLNPISMTRCSGVSQPGWITKWFRRSTRTGPDLQSSNRIQQHGDGHPWGSSARFAGPATFPRKARHALHPGLGGFFPQVQSGLGTKRGVGLDFPQQHLSPAGWKNLEAHEKKRLFHFTLYSTQFPCLGRYHWFSWRIGEISTQKKY